MLTDVLIVKAKVKYWLEALLDKAEVIVPKFTGTLIEYAPFRRGEEVMLEFKTPVLSPKIFFFPKSERILKYQKKKSAVNVIPAPVETRARVIFGVKPCDAKALLLLDKQLLRVGAPDPYYQAHRSRTTLVGLGTSQPFETEFSTSVGSSPFGEEGLDMLFYDLGKEFYVKVLTDKGKRLLDDNFTPAEEFHRKTAGEIKARAEAKASYPLNLERWQKYSPLEIFNLPYWSEVYLTCIECGACTFACPTSSNFRIVDVETGSEGERYRVWDAPTFERFAETSSGYNPRLTLKERFRDWVLEKFLFFPLEHQDINCTGCGRCIEVCPVKIDFRKVVGNVRFE